MKRGLMFPTISAKDINEFKTDSRKFAIQKRIKMQEQNSVAFEKMLDKWKHSAHTVQSNEDIINCIIGNQSND